MATPFLPMGRPVALGQTELGVSTVGPVGLCLSPYLVFTSWFGDWTMGVGEQDSPAHTVLLSTAWA